tara:strand:- start:2563 stop:2805 length:243 start_codon:yes stop_codon:yes gene_type:complete
MKVVEAVQVSQTKVQKVEDALDLRRDSFSSGIINVDNNALEAYKKRKNQSRKIETLADDINNIKVEMQELKLLLIKMVEK